MITKAAPQEILNGCFEWKGETKSDSYFTQKQ